ncbi:MAG: glycoside hydrolase family 2 TIM barrel-domain containing protein, partial [bacterium]
NATGALLPGEENTLAVRVDNRRSYTDVPPRLWKKEKLGWWSYGGIGRTAKLVWSQEVSINKAVIHARPEEEGKGRLAVSGLVYNHGDEAKEVTLTARLRKGAEVICSGQKETGLLVPAKACAQFDLGTEMVEGIEPWSPASPSLYTLEIEAASGDEVDRVKERIGFQSFEVRDGELLLNGEPMWLRGMNRHEDDPETGFFQTDERMAQDMELLKELHVNHMRPGHYPNDPRWLYLCDREGISLTEEIPLYQASSGVLKWFEARFMKDRKDVPLRVGGEYSTLSQMTDPQLLDNASQQLIEMIERDRNHASIIMWSVGNENLTYLKRARKMYKRLISVCKRFDPEREVTFALLCGPGVSPLLEKTGDLADVLFLNEYYGWYFGEASGVGGLLDKFHEKYPEKPIVISEFGAGTVAGRHSDKPEKFSEEYQVHVYETQLKEVRARPFVKGTMPWILADFRCPWFKEEHPVYEMNLKGLLDYERKRKKMAFETIREFYAEKAAGR